MLQIRVHQRLSAANILFPQHVSNDPNRDLGLSDESAVIFLQKPDFGQPGLITPVQTFFAHRLIPRKHDS